MSIRVFEIVSRYLESGINIPVRKTSLSAGYDLSAAEDIEIKPWEIKLVPTGIKVLMSKGEVLKIYARSSLAINKKLMLANGVGIIDADYYNNESNEGEIFIPLLNFGDKPFKILKGERVAQGIFENFYTSSGDEAGQSSMEKRTGGFGSTGK
jgi:dUTP pyrophosphatase